ncbi:MAG TPA: acyl-CoA dehydrogenase family protein [Candidatus Binataceae bacterium]|nr:acyl-CoA dehydrogenase family protein [Candidatus Binataceae bacterium]
MDFNYSQEDEAFRREFRAWLEQNAPRRHKPPVDGMADEGEEDWRGKIGWYRKLASGGWTCVDWPREYGGRGLSILQTIIYHEELQRFNAPAPFIGSGPGLVGPTLMQWGSQEQRTRFVPKIISGEEVWCQGYSEPNAGSDLASLQTRAIEDGDYFRITGQKIWTSQAQYADWGFVLCRTDPEAPKHRGISYILVDWKTPGITVRPLVQMNGAKGFNEVFFDDVKVPRQNLVGEKNQGWQVAITTLMYERNVGGGGRPLLGVVDELARLARRVLRDGKPAWEDNDVRQKIAEFKCEGEALRYTYFRQLTRRLKGLPPGPEGSHMKLGASELNLRIQLFAMELLGPYSQLEYGSPRALDEGRWSFRMLGARGGTIAAGTNQVQHNIIGERVLGLPKG